MLQSARFTVTSMKTGPGWCGGVCNSFNLVQSLSVFSSLAVHFSLQYKVLHLDGNGTTMAKSRQQKMSLGRIAKVSRSKSEKNTCGKQVFSVLEKL